MTPRRTLLAGALVAVALAVTAPSAGAQVPVTTPGAGSGICAGVVANPGEIRAPDVEHQQCAVLGFIGPAIGQIASVVGPTIISPGYAGTVIVASGNVVAGAA